MVGKIILLCVLIFIETIIPPAISPFSYSLMGVLLVQKIHPFFLSGLVIGISTVSSVFTWFFLEYLIQKVRTYQVRNHHQDWFSRMEKSYHRLLGDKKKNSFSHKLTCYVDSKEGNFWVFLFSFITLASALPDLVTVRIVKNHLSFPAFVISAFIGKSIAYLPVIFLGKGLVELFHR